MGFYKKHLIIFSFIAICNGILCQTTYKTKAAGLWSSSYTWENSVVPPNPLNFGDSIIVSNHVTITSDIDINGVLYIKPNIQVLSGNSTIYVGRNRVNEGLVLNKGILHLNNLVIQSVGSNGDDLHPVVINEKVLTAINVTVGNDFQCGKLINHTAGSIHITHTVTLEGEISNTGIINISNLIESHGGYIDGCGRINVQNIRVRKGTVNAGHAPSVFRCVDLCYQNLEPNFYIDNVLFKNYNSVVLNGDPQHLYFSEDSVFVCGTNFYGNNLSGVLPVELTLFGSLMLERDIILYWCTASEHDSDYFTVQHSPDGVSWKDIGVVQGAGNSTSSIHYSFVDINPFLRWNYYRLKQTDFNGTEKIKRETSIFYNPLNVDGGVCFPNPSSQYIEFFSSIDEHTGFKVISYNGKDVTDVCSVVHQGESRLHLDISNLQNGVYFLNVKSKRIKFIKV